jgi:hypothetical protein
MIVGLANYMAGQVRIEELKNSCLPTDKKKFLNSPNT